MQILTAQWRLVEINSPIMSSNNMGTKMKNQNQQQRRQQASTKALNFFFFLNFARVVVSLTFAFHAVLFFLLFAYFQIHYCIFF